MSRIHPQARTTPRTRAEINASTQPVQVLARLYNITVATARKWHQRDSMEDRSDNGSQFTDRFTSRKREPTGQHVFDQQCALLGYAHRLCPPRHPQTNGMVERFNGRISEVVKQTRFASAAELENTLMLYLKTYNHSIAQRALKHLTPVAALKKWQQEKPELFVKRVYNQAGLDSQPQLGLYSSSRICALSPCWRAWCRVVLYLWHLLASTALRSLSICPGHSRRRAPCAARPWHRIYPTT